MERFRFDGSTKKLIVKVKATAEFVVIVLEPNSEKRLI